MTSPPRTDAKLDFPFRRVEPRSRLRPARKILAFVAQGRRPFKVTIGYDECQKMAATLIPLAVVGCLLLAFCFDCFRGVLAPTLQCCSFSSGPQSEVFFLVGFMSSFGSSSFSYGSQAVLFPDCFLLQFCKLPPFRWAVSSSLRLFPGFAS